ncbi:MAG TPA: YihY/virulence factor BrkB family protein [Stellaceae bacterium]
MAQGRIERSLSLAGSIYRSVVAGAQEWAGVLRAAINSWLGDRAPSMGAAIAYYTVFSLAPVLILVIAVAGLAFGQRAAEGALFDQIAALVGNESAGAIQAMLRSASGTSSGIIATLVGLGALVIAATGVFGELQAAFNVIWKAQPAKGAGMRNLVKVRLRSLLLIMAIGLLLMLSLALGTALAALSAYLERVLPGLPLILGVLNFVFSLAVTTVMFALMFRILPDAGVEWPDVWIGAAASALLFTIGRHFISLYIGSSGVTSTYHAAGALVLILVWIYYSAQIVLFGAELAKAYGDRRRAKRIARHEPPAAAGQ